MWKSEILGGVKFMDSSSFQGGIFGNTFWNFHIPYYTSQPCAAKSNLSDVDPQQHAHLTFVFNFRFSLVELIGLDYYWGTGSIPAFAPHWKHKKHYFLNKNAGREGPARQADSTCQRTPFVRQQETSPENSRLCEIGPECHLRPCSLL